MWTDTFKLLLDGAWVSLKIFGMTALFSLPLGMLLAVLTKYSFFSKLITIYTVLFRGTPLMMQLILLMFGLPMMGIKIDRMMVAYIAFSLNYTAYFTEIFKSGITAIEPDQIDAARIFGANEFQVYYYIVLPQAFSIQSPVITSELINLIKDTSIVSVIAVVDILRVVREMVSKTFTLTPFIFSTLFYLCISLILVIVLNMIHKKMNA